MKALITGMSGFVGPFLRKSLSKNGYAVYGLDRQNPKKDKKIKICDITDSEAVEKVIADIKPDAIFHLAGQSSVEKSWSIPEETHKINVEGTSNLLGAVVNSKLSSKILIISSADVYGQQDKLPITEDAVLHPWSPYAESRVEQEQIALRFYEKYDLHITIARSFHHTGPGQSPPFVMPSFAKQIADIEKEKQKPVIKVGNLAVERDIADVRDVVEAYRILMEKGEAGHIYNVCSGRKVSIGWVLDHLRSLSKETTNVTVQKDNSLMRKNDVDVAWGDNSKLRELGWNTTIPLEQTLKDLLTYWREQ